MVRRLVNRVLTAALLASMLTSTALLVAPAQRAAAEPEGNFGGAFSEDHKVYAHHPNWMANLPDDLLIGELSLPGTHNSGAILNNNLSQTQTLSFAQQLDAGIRVFDIRYVCKGKETADNTGPFDKLEYYHGSVNQNLDIVDIFDDFRVFLDANPRETILYSLKNESDNDPLGQPHQDTCGETRKQAAVDALLGDGRWADRFYVDTDEDGLDDNNERLKYGTAYANDAFDTDGDGFTDSHEVYRATTLYDPTKKQTYGTTTDVSTAHVGDGDDYVAPRLGELRGKMWDFKSGDFSQVVALHNLPQSPGGNDAYKVCTTEVTGCAYHVGADAVSDPADRADSREKIDVLADFIDEANASAAPYKDLYFADMSGSTFVIPREAARGEAGKSGINQPILNWLVNNHPTYTKVGILSMDFPGPGLISRIIHYNQRYGLLPKTPTTASWPAHTVGTTSYPARSYTLRSLQEPDPDFEVGVLKGDGPCPENSEVSVRMDTEDNNPSNEATGWLGGSFWDSNAVTLVFCRVPGQNHMWIPPTAGFYGLLKLGNRCPSFSNEITRTSDNEDTNNNNQTTGDFMANDLGPNSGYTGQFIGDSTRFTICSFNAADRPAGSTAGYPDLGFSYGVLGTPRPNAFAMDYGWVSADDEDTNNANTADPGFDSGAWGGMISGRLRYTVFHTMKVRGVGAPTLTTNPAQPANDGRVPVEYRGTNGNIQVTALTGIGNPAVLSDNPPNLKQRATFVIDTPTVKRWVPVALNSAGKATFNVSDLPPGDYDLTIIYDDQRAHFDSAQTTLKITVADDPTHPTITMTSPKSGAVLGGGTWNACASFDPNVTGDGICGRATSNDPIEGLRVNLRGPNNKWWDGTGFNANDPLVLDAPLHTQLSPIPNGVQFFMPVNPALMPTGSYLANIEAAETIAGTTMDVPFTFDNSAPVISFTNPPTAGTTYSAFNFGEQCQAPSQRGLCGFIDEFDSGIDQLDVTLQHNGGPFVLQNVQYIPVVGSPGRYAWWVPIEPDDIEGGNYVVDVHVVDKTNNEVSVQRGFALNAEPPEVTFTGPTLDALHTELLGGLADWPTPCTGGGTTRKVGRFCGTTTDDLGVTSVEFSIQNTAYQYYDFTTNTWDTTPAQYRPEVRKLLATSAGPWAIDFPGSLADGRYVVRVLAKDAHHGESEGVGLFVWDTTAPQVEVTISGEQGTGGWYKSAVAITGKDPGALTNTTCVATPSKVQVSTANGTGSVVCTDAFGRSSSPKSFSFKNDMTKPTVNFVTNPAASASGWYKSQPSVQATGTDNFDTTPQCEMVGSPTPVTNGVSVTGKCIDDAGNITTASKTLQIDSGLPTVSVSLTPNAANGLAGWYTSAPTGHATGTDALSGIDSCQADTAFAGADGQNKSISMTCNDKAGNTGTGISSVFKLDRVGPSVTVAPTPVLPDGANSWYVTKPTFSTTATDATSGVNTTTCSAPTAYGGVDSAAAVQTGSCKDNAGNFTLASSNPFKLDTVNPTATVAPKTAPNGTNGWYKTNPVIATSGTDATSGIDTCTADTPYAGGDTATATASGTCKDKAGRMGTANATAFKVDTTGPVVAVAPTTAPNGTNGWYKTNPVIGTTATDATSGVASCPPNAAYAGGDSASATATGSCTDNAGNTSSATSAPFKVDTVKPSVACPSTTPVFLLRQANASFVPVVSDSGSGANPAAASSVNTSQVGSFTTVVTGSDAAGNTNTATCTYQVTYELRTTRTLGTPRIAGLATSFGLSLHDATGANVSARTITLTPTFGHAASDRITWTGKGWSMTHKTSSTPGVYTIKLKASGDPVEHSFQYETNRLGALSQLLGLP